MTTVDAPVLDRRGRPVLRWVVGERERSVGRSLSRLHGGVRETKSSGIAPSANGSNFRNRWRPGARFRPRGLRLGIRSSRSKWALHESVLSFRGTTRDEIKAPGALARVVRVTPTLPPR